MLYRKEMWETKEGRAWILKTQLRLAVGLGRTFEEAKKHNVSQEFIDIVKKDFGLTDEDVYKIYLYYKREITYDDIMKNGSEGLKKIFSMHLPIKK